MGERKCHIARKLYFCRWSRKGYAVFASLGREVHIGQLALHVCAMSLKKAARKGLVIDRILSEWLMRWQENTGDTGSDPGTERVMQEGMMPVLSCGDNAGACGSVDNKLGYDIGMSEISGLLFYFFKIC